MNETNGLITRKLFHDIDWNYRLIGITGTRGVGKTTFLLEFAKKRHDNDNSCLYVNMNNFMFANRTLVSFADEFYKRGGKVLIIDQINKYSSWAEELRYIHDHFTDLQVIFAGSSILKLSYENEEIHDIVKSYVIEGLSFREFLNQEAGTNFPFFSIKDILANHVDISKQITSEVKPLAYFSNYLSYGFYPFYLETKNFSEFLLKTVNLILEIDITYINQIELKYLPKIKQLLYTIGKQAPLQPNVSKLSHYIEISRITVMNYLKYLRRARLINLLYHPGDEKNGKKPDLVYLHDTNLMQIIYPYNINNEILRKTFFLNQIQTTGEVTSAENAHFRLEDSLFFDVGGRHLQPEENASKNKYYAADMIEIGAGKQIPLWLFGFLY